MSGPDRHTTQVWPASFADPPAVAILAPDAQPGWKLSAFGITVGVMLLLMLSI